MTARANGGGPFPRPHRDDDGLFAAGEAGLLVDKSWDGMALVQNPGKAHELSGVDTKMETNPDSPPLTPAALLPYCRDCRDLSEWPERWMGEDGGPLIHNGWEDEQRSFDSTCRKFCRFLTQPRP